MIDWFAKNSAAIQALASIAGVIIAFVLAGITCWYVILTRGIARSSAEQVRQMKDASQAIQKRNMQALLALASRLRNSLGTLDADEPRSNQLLGFTQLTESDLVQLEAFTLRTDNASILAAGGSAVVALREILNTIHWGNISEWKWAPGPDRNTRWRRAREESDRSLHLIENECAAIINPEADLKKKTAAVLSSTT